MSERFKRMEGVEGLRDILALSRESGELAYCSEGLDPEASAEIAERIRSEFEAAPAALHRVIITIGEDRVLIFPSGEHYLALHVGPQFDIATLRSRLSEGDRAAQVRKKKPDSPIEEGDLQLLARAIETVSKPVIGELGIFVAVNAMRSEREAMLVQHKPIRTFAVGKDGRISHGEPRGMILEEVVAAVAQWIIRFLKHCDNIVPAFPPKMAVSLLEPMHNELQGIGLLEALDAALSESEAS